MNEFIIFGLLGLVIAGWAAVLIWNLYERRKLNKQGRQEEEVESWV